MRSRLSSRFSIPSPVGRSRGGGEGGELLRYTQRNQVLLTAVIRSQTNRGNSKAALSLHSREKLARPFLTSIFRFQERGRFINAVEIKCETQTGCFDCTSSSVVILALCILLCSSLPLPCFYYFIMRYTSVCCDFHFGLRLTEGFGAFNSPSLFFPPVLPSIASGTAVGVDEPSKFETTSPDISS